MTGDVVSLIARLETKPSVLVSGSAIGWYGLWQDQVLTESAKSHECFSHDLCEAWETRGKGGRGARGEGGVPAHRPRARHRGRLHHAHADAVRVRAWRSDRHGPAVDVLDRARRSDPPDRACDRAQARFPARSTRPRRSPSPTTSSPRSWRVACTGPRCSAFPMRCCGGSAAISPASSCSAASACCPTRR